MNRDMLMGFLVFAIIFLLGVEVLASTRDDYSLRTQDDEIIIVIKPLPTSEISASKLSAEQEPMDFDEQDKTLPQRTASAAAKEFDEQEFKIQVHPVAENH